MAAFELAIEQGADAIELDIWPSHDGQAMVIHDHTLERTTDGKGSLDEWSSADLRELDAGSGERIPTLDEVLDLTAGRVWLDVELKTAAAVPALCTALARAGTSSELLVSSFDGKALQSCRKHLPKVRRGLVQGTPTLHPVVRAREAVPHGQLRRLDATALITHHKLCWKGLAKSVRALGVDLLAWTVMGEEARSPTKIWKRLLSLQVDGIVTTRPGDLRAFLTSAVQPTRPEQGRDS